MNKQHTLMIERLTESADEVVAAAKKLSSEQLAKIPKEGEWSLHQSLSHLRDTDVQVFLPRTELILDSDEPPAVAVFDQNEWNDAHYAADEPLDQVLGDLRRARRKLVKLLDNTTDKDWALYCLHPTMGKMSIEFIALHTYNHTLEHLQQLLDAQEMNLIAEANGG